MSFTANPRAEGNHPQSDEPRVPAEATGAVAKDSLAAESMSSGGDFAADSSSAAPLGVSGSNSTLNTTDTSGATPLHPASSGAAREARDASGAGSDEAGPGGMKYPDALGGQGSQSGATTSEGHYYGGASSGNTGAASSGQPAGASDFGASTSASGPDSSEIKSGSAAGGNQSSSTGNSQSSSTGNNQSSTTSTSAGGNQSSTPTSAGGNQSSSTSTGGDQPSTSTSGSTGTSTSGSSAGVRPFVESAPNYAGRVSGAISNDNELQPKGDNLTEGDIPQTKTFTGDVGGPNDPGRLAEQAFEKTNANAVGGASRDKQGERDGGQYDVLESERA